MENSLVVLHLYAPHKQKCIVKPFYDRKMEALPDQRDPVLKHT